MASPYKQNASGYKRGSHIAGPLKNDVRYQNTNRADLSGLAHAVEPEQVISFRDFVNQSEYVTADWTVTAAGAGTAAVSTTAPNGTLVITTGAASSNSESLQNTTAPWRSHVIGCDLWYRSRFEIDANPTGVELFMGLAAVSATPLTAPRIGFHVASANAGQIYAECFDGTTLQSIPTGVFLPAGQFVECSWHQTCGPEGIAAVIFFINNALAGQIALNIPASTVPLTQTMLVQTDAAAARALTVDSLLTAQSRNA